MSVTLYITMCALRPAKRKDSGMRIRMPGEKEGVGGQEKEEEEEEEEEEKRDMEGGWSTGLAAARVI